jgi:curli biogenesis system outer membrane secretion channel CsgG
MTMKQFWVLILLSVAGFGQTAPAPATTKPHRPAVAAKSIVDSVIDLVKGGMSEALVIKQLQREGKPYELTTPDLVRLQKAGVSENIINVMLDPKTPVTPSLAVSNVSANKDSSPGGAPPAPAPPPPASADASAVAADTPYPPDLPNVPAVRKRRVVIAPFSFGALGTQIQAIYYLPWAPFGGAVPANKNVTDDLGQGIRAMLMNRLQQTNAVTVLEHSAAVDQGIIDGPSALMDPASRPKMGRKLGADSVVTGDITTFGRDDKNKCTGGVAGAITRHFPVGVGGAGVCKKEDKAVVAIEFRLVDAETSEVLLTANAKGQSTRKSNRLDFGGLGISSGGAAGGVGSTGTSTSNFEKTILGEATSDAIDQIVKQIQEKIPQLPIKPRKIEGRVAQISPNGIYLALGRNDGVLPGDRFEIRQINNQVLDPQTKEPIATEAVKVGELVISEVEDKSSMGNYGGHPLSADYITGKGYQARLMSK